jgi:tRNA(Arg) A34 adenosine deaminase TadA
MGVYHGLQLLFHTVSGEEKWTKIYADGHPGGEKSRFLRRGPVGAVVVSDGKVIARGYNKREKKQNALAHAELRSYAGRAVSWGDGA